MTDFDKFFIPSGNCRLDAQLKFTAEIDKMTSVYRKTLLIDRSRAENDAEHSWHIAVMALLFEEYAVEKVNLHHAIEMLIGALKAYKESKRKDVKVFVGGGGSKNIVKMVKDKDPLVKATVTYPPRMIETGADLALKGLRNNKKNPGAREVVVKSEVVTPANAEKHYFPDSLY